MSKKDFIVEAGFLQADVIHGIKAWRSFVVYNDNGATYQIRPT